MYEQLNKLGGEVVKRATYRMKGWKHIGRNPRTNKVAGLGYAATVAAEVSTLLPVRNRQDFETLDAHLIVVRAHLRMNPPLHEPVREALDSLMREARLVRYALED
jgi:hypothetical protein